MAAWKGRARQGHQGRQGLHGPSGGDATTRVLRDKLRQSCGERSKRLPGTRDQASFPPILSELVLNLHQAHRHSTRRTGETFRPLIRQHWARRVGRPRRPAPRRRRRDAGRVARPSARVRPGSAPVWAACQHILPPCAVVDKVARAHRVWLARPHCKTQTGATRDRESAVRATRSDRADSVALPFPRDCRPPSTVLFAFRRSCSAHAVHVPQS